MSIVSCVDQTGSLSSIDRRAVTPDEFLSQSNTIRQLNKLHEFNHWLQRVNEHQIQFMMNLFFETLN